jgi:putative nucleotidyltransferase with HDIG domain
VSRTILVADDEVHVVDILALTLRKAGYEVLCAADGAEALELCRRHRPALAVVDWGMPAVDGLELCRRIQADPALESMHRIMLTSRGFRMDPEKQESAGVAMVLSKPFSPKTVVARIAELLDDADSSPGGIVDTLRWEGPATLLGCLKDVQKTLGEVLAPLAMNSQTFDAAGDPIDPMCLRNRFCRMTCDLPTPCSQAVSELAALTLRHQAPQSHQLDPGCMLLGVPVSNGRHLAGAVVTSCPTPAMANPQRLERLAHEAGIGPDEARALARTACRHEPWECDDLLFILGRLVADQWQVQESQVKLTALGGNLASTYEELSLVYRISGAMNVTHRPDEFLQLVCGELREVMGLAAIAGIAYPRGEQTEDQVVTDGEIDLSVPQLRMLGAWLCSEHIHADNPTAVLSDFDPPDELGLGGDVHNLIATTLTAGSERMGLLIGLNKQVGELRTVDMKLIHSVGSQTAVFLANRALYTDLQQLLMGILYSLTTAIDAKDAYTRGHSERVAQISRIIARQCGLSEAENQRAYLSGLLHDIGKIGVPESILAKPGKLTDEEYTKIKEHPHTGAAILEDIRQLEDVVVAMLTHHERIDGRGYPSGLAGDEIPIIGRIVGLADCFDAMTSSRTYRAALSLDQARDEIRKGAGSQFDPYLVNIFLAMDLEKLLEWLYDPAAVAVRQQLPPETLLRPQTRLSGPSPVGQPLAGAPTPR